MEPLLRHRSEHADREPRSRERMAAHDLLGKAELPPHLPHLVLEQLAQRLDELPRQIGPQAADVVVRFDRHRWPAPGRSGLDHVGIQRSLDEEADVPGNEARRVSEQITEAMPDAATLLLWVVDPGELAQKARAAIHET